MSYYTLFNNVPKGNYFLGNARVLNIEKEKGKINLSIHRISQYWEFDLYKDNRIVKHEEKGNKTYRPRYTPKLMETLDKLLEATKQSYEYKLKKKPLSVTFKEAMKNSKNMRKTLEDKQRLTYDSCIQLAADVFLSDPE